MQMLLTTATSIAVESRSSHDFMTDMIDLKEFLELPSSQSVEVNGPFGIQCAHLWKEVLYEGMHFSHHIPYLELVRGRRERESEGRKEGREKKKENNGHWHRPPKARDQMSERQPAKRQTSGMQQLVRERAMPLLYTE